MGQVIVRCAAQAEDLTIAAALEQSSHPAIGQDAGTVAGIAETGVKIADEVSDTLEEGGVVVDFTFHEAVPANAALACKHGMAIVIGTTGLDEAERGAIELAATTVPVVWAPNMSLGMNLLFSVVEKASSVLGPDYRIDIDETHHVHKKDAPSGTALHLGEKAAVGRDLDFEAVYLHDPDGKTGEHPPGKIVIRSHREGEVVGVHTVGFENEGERVEFTHRAFSRDALAMGALHAARWVASREPGLYDMQDVLGL